MNKTFLRILIFALPALCVAQEPPPGFFPGGPGGFGGPGRFGPPPGMGATQKVVKKFDKDGDKRLNAAERAEARKFLAEQPRMRMPFGGGGAAENVTPGPALQPDKVKRYGKEDLYDLAVLRTVFLEFENPEWEKELAAFNNTDVELPAKVTIDGKSYADVGVHFRGNTSFMMVPEGKKRSLNLSFDFVNKEQRALGVRTMNLLNSASDPSSLRTVLYLKMANEYIAAPKANLMRVVINGESWGIYVNAEQFNSDFAKRHFQVAGGRRWKVPGSPMGRGGLNYIGDDVSAYKRIYEIKSKDEPAAWADLIRLCRILTETAPEKLEAALSSMLDVDGALKFLALEKIGSNEDGYWTRASDYSLYQNPQGKFFVVPHDANETFRPAMGMGFGGPRGPRRPGGAGEPGGFGGPPPGFGDPDGAPGSAKGNPAGPTQVPFRGGREENAKLDPFAGEKDPNKALLNKLLAVPALRQRYVGYLREMATTWLDWDKKVGPIAFKAHAMIDSDFKTDTRQLSNYEAFKSSLLVDQKLSPEQGSGRPNMMAGPKMSLKSYVDQRREYLLSHPELQAKE